MCVTNIYVDLYPDGRRQEFRQTSTCQYGAPGRPCAKASTLENPVRKIQWGEPTTEYMLTSHQRFFPQTFPATPPRSSGGSNHRRSGEYSSGEEGLRGRRRDSKNGKEKDKRPEPIRRATREHRKERIVIVDSPPTPRTPPQVFNQVFTAPNSPVPRAGRPIIVDERPRRRASPTRNPSVGAVVGDRVPNINRRSRSSSRPRRPSSGGVNWDSPSSSHTSFSLQTQLEEQQAAAALAAEQLRRQERDNRIAVLEAERRRAEFIARQDDEIRRRPAVPLSPPPQRLRNRAFLHQQPQPQPEILPMAGLNINERPVPVIVISDEATRRREERERAARLRWEAEEEEAMRQRLRERQMPQRRFSVGPAMRRHRVLYDDGVYRYE